MNTTLKVGTYYDCDHLSEYEGTVYKMGPIWRQTVFGCNILEILKNMYGFNVTYVLEGEKNNLTLVGGAERAENRYDQSIDLYLRPLNLAGGILDHMYPVYAAYTWRFGFILRRPNYMNYITFYSKPFTRPAWNCLYGMALFVSLMFYFLKRWELITVGGHECSYVYELLTVIGGYCQHIPPIDATIASRRIAYFVYLIFAYIIYTYYTSNLLSHLVNDKDHGITLNNLASTNLEVAIVDYMWLNISNNVPIYLSNYTYIINKLLNLKSVSVTRGLEGVRNGEMALLSDHVSLSPFLKKSFNTREICELSTVDVFKNIKKYFFTSKHFMYKEQIKIGALRIKESGIFKRLMSIEYEAPTCDTIHLAITMFVQITIPLAMLLCTYVICICIMIIEKVHYKRNKVWPYVE